MGGCQNYGPFLGYPKYEVPYYNKDPKRDHDFDNPPYYKTLVFIYTSRYVRPEDMTLLYLA